MTTVVDASVLVAALVDSGSEGEWAEFVIADGARVGPELVLVETCNILRRFERTGQVPMPEAGVWKRLQ